MATTSSNADLAPYKVLSQKGPAIALERSAGGVVYLRSEHPPGVMPRSIPHLLAERAERHPDRPFLLKRAPGHGAWAGITYAQAKRGADGVAQWLLSKGFTKDDCVMVLSSNSVEHGLMMLGCYAAGIPIAPVSPAYSLVSSDHAKLGHCFATVAPRLVFVQNYRQFERACQALKSLDPDILFVSADGEEGTISVQTLIETRPTEAVEQALAGVGPDTVAKFLFTSGSTGMPKCVPQTQRMLTGYLAALDGLRNEPVDPDFVPPTLGWMPWAHISAGNIGFNTVLWEGGTLYIDEGRPLPGQFETTIENLRGISPRSFASAPLTFSMLVEAMEADQDLRSSFFRNLRTITYAGATLSNDVADRLQRLSIAESGYRIPITTMYGATETQPVTTVHWVTDRVGLIGLPLPGSVLKLVPNGDKLEVRVSGPTVMPGYHRDPARTAAAFDEEGFYKLGDACRFVDPEHPELGLVFDGRVTEDFKLDSGTWVSVGTLRPEVLAACSPYLSDGVIAGQDKSAICALFWPAPAALGALEGDAMAKLADLVSDRLAIFNRTAGGSSRRVARFVLLTEPPSTDAGEITDKGYINQRATLERRRHIVEDLYAPQPSRRVIVVP